MSADLLAAPPGASVAAEPLIALDDAASYPPAGASGINRRAVPAIPPSPDWDEPARRGSMAAWIFVALSVLLAATLGWVLYTQTDLFEGDVVARRDAEAQTEAKAEIEAAERAQQSAKQQVGTFTLSSEPPKARVWMVAVGPEATFENLPPDGEYMVAVAAAGHQPRVRVVKGSELVAPVVVDLDPLDAEAAAAVPPEIPTAAVPKVGRETKAPVTLVLRSNTPDARLMLLVGYTPGATVVDLDVSETHRFLVTLEGHEDHEIELKGRHWDETEAGELVYDERVQLRPRAAAPAPASASDG